MSFTLCTSGAIVIKAGFGVSSTAKVSGAILAQFSDEAEGTLNARTRYDWVTNYNSVGAKFKPMLADATACLAAISLVSYDMSGYTSRSEAENVVNILWDRAEALIKVIADDKLKTTAGIINA